MEPEVVFRAEGLSKVYRVGEVEVHALRDVDLELRRGEFAVILGPSGSGKSTLLNILGGLDVPTRGRVRFLDHDLTQDDERALTAYRREHVGFVFQFYNLIPSLTALENVALVTEVSRQPIPPEEALALDSSLLSVHSPLAMAYRGLGQTANAEAHLKLWKNTEVLVPDPLRQELDLALESGLSYELRGVRALEARDFNAAANFFEQGVKITSAQTGLGRSLRHKLATAMYMKGDIRGAMKWFEETLRAAPDSGIDETAAKAHYSLGVLMASTGRGQDAITHLSAAVRFSPNYVEAYQALADALLRAGRVEASLAPYAEAIRLNPKAADARFGYGIALVRLGRYREARGWLEEGSRLHPDRSDFNYALARILAAAPDDQVRNGQRALAIVEELVKTSKTIDLGETMAMSLAEIGRYDEAVAIQRQVIEAANRGGLTAVARRMAGNLQRYERRQPCRQPWTTDDPIHSPGPPIDPTLLSSVTPS